MVHFPLSLGRKLAMTEREHNVNSVYGKLIDAVFVGVFFWLAYSVDSMKSSVSVLGNDISSIKERLKIIDSEFVSRRELEERVKRIEDRLNLIEQRYGKMATEQKSLP